MRRRGEGDAPLPGAPGRTWGRGVGNGCQPRGSEGELRARPGLLQSRGRGKHNFSLCNSSGLAQLLAKYFRSREEKTHREKREVALLFI